MMTIGRTFILLLLAVALLSCRTTRMEQTGFLDRTVRIGSVTYPYVVYLPRDYDRSRFWPVILSLHGIGERGSDGQRATQIGVAKAIRSAPERVTAIAVFPQAPLDATWLGPTAGAAMLALERSITEFNGDPDRVYLTGLSMGGYGTWHLALAHPDRFAALVPVCGGILPQAPIPAVLQSPLTTQSADPHGFVAHELRHLPIWIFHGAADTTVAVSESRRMAEELRKEGPGSSTPSIRTWATTRGIRPTPSRNCGNGCSRSGASSQNRSTRS